MQNTHSTGSLYIISAPSGAGKTSLIKELLQEMDKLNLSVSHTTRAMRSTEQDGRDYFFTSVEDFSKMIDEKHFVEHACVFENFYGTSALHIQDVLDEGRDLILEIDWQGAEQVQEKFPDCLSIFILPPSKKELANRLNGRGTDSEEVINKRMQQAELEMSHYHNYDYIVVNDQFDDALNELKAIITSNRLLNHKQVLNLKALIDDLL